MERCLRDLERIVLSVKVTCENWLFERCGVMWSDLRDCWSDINKIRKQIYSDDFAERRNTTESSEGRCTKICMTVHKQNVCQLQSAQWASIALTVERHCDSSYDLSLIRDISRSGEGCSDIEKRLLSNIITAISLQINTIWSVKSLDQYIHITPTTAVISRYWHQYIHITPTTGVISLTILLWMCVLPWFV